jgi:hypothetical protein
VASEVTMTFRHQRRQIGSGILIATVDRKRAPAAS